MEQNKEFGIKVVSNIKRKIMMQCCNKEENKVT